MGGRRRGVRHVGCQRRQRGAEGVREGSAAHGNGSRSQGARPVAPIRADRLDGAFARILVMDTPRTRRTARRLRSSRSSATEWPVARQRLYARS